MKWYMLTESAYLCPIDTCLGALACKYICAYANAGTDRDKVEKARRKWPHSAHSKVLEMFRRADRSWQASGWPALVSERWRQEFGS